MQNYAFSFARVEYNITMPAIKTFAEAREMLLAYIPSKLTRSAYTLETMRELMAFLGDPQNDVRTVHVAGTSGKTSTSYYAAALLQAAGYKVGLAVSPHVDEINERAQINCMPLSEKIYCAEFTVFMQLVQKSGLMPSYFELLAAFAFWEFARQKVDYAVIEVGLGGLLDATNVIERADKTCIITDIGLDHVTILGNTLPEIAVQKAGIMHAHNATFCYRQSADVTDVFELQAKKAGADLHVLEAQKLPLAFDFLPLFQRRNFALSLQAVQFVLRRDHGIRLDETMRLAAAHTYVPARMETLDVGGKTVILDGAHNPQKLQTLLASVAEKYPGQSIAALVSFVAGREYRIEPAVQEIVHVASHLIVSTFDGPQDFPNHSVEPAEIAAAAESAGLAVDSIEIIADAAAAWRALLARPERVLLVTGSFYFLNHIRPIVLRRP